MLPEFPILVKCSKCGHFLWLNRMDPLNNKLANLSPIAINAKPAMFLSIDEYFEALTSGACTNKEDELDIRIYGMSITTGIEMVKRCIEMIMMKAYGNKTLMLS